MAERDVLWLDRRRPAPTLPLTGWATADVAVVGAGFTGLWTALTLLERDPALRVVVLEARRAGTGASGRNGGFFDPSLTHGLLNGVRHFGDELGRLEQLAAENDAGFSASLERHRIDCAFERTGMLDVGTAAWHVEELREWARVHAAHGHDVEWLDAEEAQQALASPQVRCAVRRPAAGGVLDPVALVDGLVAAVLRLGGALHEGTPVTALERSGGAVRVTTPQGALLADRVVLAADAWSSGLLRRTRRHYVTVYDYVLVTEPLTADQLASIGWKGREGVSDAVNRFHYSRLTADDRVLWGGFDAVRHGRDLVGEGFDRWPPTHERLERHLRAFFPQLAGVGLTHRWGGPIAVTTRFTPVFGSALRDRVHYALGYTGLGVAASRFAARVLVDRLLDPSSKLLQLEYVRRPPFPFPPEPARTAAVGLTQRALERADAREGRRGLWLRTLDRMGVGFDS